MTDLSEAFSEDRTMGGRLGMANVVDLDAYRAKRAERLLADRVDNLAQNYLMFTALPVLVPMIAWIPVWGMMDMSRREGVFGE
jgi:hypothetical protein